MSLYGKSGSLLYRIVPESLKYMKSRKRGSVHYRREGCRRTNMGRGKGFLRLYFDQRTDYGLLILRQFKGCKGSINLSENQYKCDPESFRHSPSYFRVSVRPGPVSL